MQDERVLVTELVVCRVLAAARPRLSRKVGGGRVLEQLPDELDLRLHVQLDPGEFVREREDLLLARPDLRRVGKRRVEVARRHPEWRRATPSALELRLCAEPASERA